MTSGFLMRYEDCYDNQTGRIQSSENKYSG